MKDADPCGIVRRRKMTGKMTEERKMNETEGKEKDTQKASDGMVRLNEDTVIDTASGNTYMSHSNE